MAAKRVMERVAGVNIVPHFCRIEDKELEFYNDFSIIVLGLDSIEARSYINAVACGFLGIWCYVYLLMGRSKSISVNCYLYIFDTHVGLISLFSRCQ